ncbi:Rap1a/Tai family immunity protein [Pseudomonadales bacterium]|nr:Rap1a/Tai family immunity protein [Pseudomonadales bacterium]
MIKLLLAAIILSLSLSASTATAAFGLMSGKMLAEDCESPQESFAYGACHGYIFGVLDKELWGGDRFASICLPVGVTMKQMISIVRKYLKEHPEKHNNDASLLVTVAFQIAFPCRD